MFKRSLSWYLIKVLVRLKHKWPRVLTAARLTGVMTAEFGSMFGQPQIVVLDDSVYDEWEMAMSYESKSGIQVGISVFDDRVEIFVTERDLFHESYFTDNIGNVGEARYYLVQFINNITRDIEEAAKLGLTDKK